MLLSKNQVSHAWISRNVDVRHHFRSQSRDPIPYLNTRIRKAKFRNLVVCSIETNQYRMVIRQGLVSDFHGTTDE